MRAAAGLRAGLPVCVCLCVRARLLCGTWLNSDKDPMNMRDVTLPKQWIHFLRSPRWPPTSYLAATRPSVISKVP